MQKIDKNLPSGHHRTNMSGRIFVTKACIDNRKKNLLNSNISSRRPLGFITAAMSLTVGQPNFARSLAVSSTGTLYIDFGVFFAPLMEFCHVQNSLCVQVLRSDILAALLHCTPTAGVSQTLRRGTRNGITELSRRTFEEDTNYIRLGGHHGGHRPTF